MELWKSNLEKQFIDMKSETVKGVMKTQRLLKGKLNNRRCVKCGFYFFEGDIVAFPCHGEHFHCVDCVNDRLERQKGYIDGQDLQHKPEGLDNIIICSKCHKPLVVEKKITFHDRFEQVKIDGMAEHRVTFTLKPNLTEEVVKYHKIHKCFEYQKRSLVGRFADSKKTYTDENHRAMESRDAALRRSNNSDNSAAATNHSGVWLEGWTCDNNIGDAQGWEYRKVGAKLWGAIPGIRTLERRRRMVRTQVLLSSDVVEKLETEALERSKVDKLKQHDQQVVQRSQSEERREEN